MKKNNKIMKSKQAANTLTAAHHGEDSFYRFNSGNHNNLQEKKSEFRIAILYYLKFPVLNKRYESYSKERAANIN